MTPTPGTELKIEQSSEAQTHRKEQLKLHPGDGFRFRFKYPQYLCFYIRRRDIKRPLVVNCEPRKC